jgi:hypothetical protein
MKSDCTYFSFMKQVGSDGLKRDFSTELFCCYTSFFSVRDNSLLNQWQAIAGKKSCNLVRR